MKSQTQWFNEYAESHQNSSNQHIHYICVSLIFFSIVGILTSIDNPRLQNILPVHHPLIANWETVVLFFILLFYTQFLFKIFIEMFILSVIARLGNYYLSKVIPLYYTNLIIFVLTWVGQFYGYKIEGKKLSFLRICNFCLLPLPRFKKNIGLDSNLI